jgi:hypothetical protein
MSALSLSTEGGCPVGEPFDYESVSADVATDLQSRAERFRSGIKQTMAAIIENGRELVAARQQLAHGQFTAWIEAELGITARTAQNYMRVAELAEKSETISLLPPTIAYKLAAKTTPATIVETVVAKAAAGEIVPDSVVKEMIAEAAQERRQNQKAARRSKAAQERRERQRLEYECQRKREHEELATHVRHWRQRVGAEAVRATIELIEGSPNPLILIEEIKQQANDDLDIPPYLRREPASEARK